MNQKKSDYVFFDSTNSRRVNYKNKAFSVTADSIIELLKLGNAIVVEATRVNYKTPVFSKNVVYENFGTRKTIIQNKIYKNIVDIDFVEFQKLFAKLNLEISREELTSLLMRFNLLEKIILNY